MPIDVVDLYKKAEAESAKRKVGERGEKANEVQKIVEQIAAKVGKKKLQLAATYVVVREVMKERGEKIERTHFTQIMKNRFDVVKEDGRLYIIVK
jgi:hypothetical protein